MCQVVGSFTRLVVPVLSMQSSATLPTAIVALRMWHSLALATAHVVPVAWTCATQAYVVPEKSVAIVMVTTALPVPAMRVMLWLPRIFPATPHPSQHLAAEG